MQVSKRTYNPGQPAGIRHEGGARYTVESFREPGTFYAVDLRCGSCTCPHHARKGARCKHQVRAEEEAFRLSYRAAMILDTEALRKHLGREDLREEVKSGIIGVLRFRAEMQKIRQLEYARV